MSNKKKIIKGTIITILVLSCVYLGISGYIASSMTKLDRMPITNDPSFFGLSYEDVSFPSRADNLTLKGWYITGDEEQPTIILVHGAEGNRTSESKDILASNLVNEGYNVLMFDLRGHGESAEAHLSGGYYERFDVLGAVDYLRNRGITQICALGYSMGAASIILAAAEEPFISAIVSDSCYAELIEIIRREITVRSGLPSWFTPGCVFITKTMYGVNLDAVKPVDIVSEITCPIFFIHGAADEFVPLADVNRLYEVSKNPSNLIWIVPHANHGECYKTVPLEYIERVTAFFNEELCVDK